MRCLFLVLRNVQCNDPSLLVRLYNIYIRPYLESGMKKHENRSKNDYRTRVLHALPIYQDRLRALKMRSLKYRRIFNDLERVKLAASKYWIFRPYRRVECGITIHYKKLERHRLMLCFILSFSERPGGCACYPMICFPVEFKARLKKSDIFRILKVEDVR
ncbi:hypothetical protein COOONC_23067 [Cooperia oncophora]